MVGIKDFQTAYLDACREENTAASAAENAQVRLTQAIEQRKRAYLALNTALWRLVEMPAPKVDVT